MVRITIGNESYNMIAGRSLERQFADYGALDQLLERSDGKISLRHKKQPLQEVEWYDPSDERIRSRINLADQEWRIFDNDWARRHGYLPQ